MTRDIKFSISCVAKKFRAFPINARCCANCRRADLVKAIPLPDFTCTFTFAPGYYLFPLDFRRAEEEKKKKNWDAIETHTRVKALEIAPKRSRLGCSVPSKNCLIILQRRENGREREEKRGGEKKGQTDVEKQVNKKKKKNERKKRKRKRNMKLRVRACSDWRNHRYNRFRVQGPKESDRFL